jgi:hypothetical protein
MKRREFVPTGLFAVYGNKQPEVRLAEDIRIERAPFKSEASDVIPRPEDLGGEDIPNHNSPSFANR